jgi:hypothetical protein
MAKTRGTRLLMRWTDVPESEPWNRVRDANPWPRRVRPHMRLAAGEAAVFRRITPPLGAAGR